MTPLENGQRSGDWKEWSMFVLKTIEKMEVKIDQLEDTVNKNNSEFKTSLVELQTKAGFAGGIFGVVSSLIVSIIAGVVIYYITNKEVDKNSNTPPQHYQQRYQQYPQGYQQRYQQSYPNEMRQQTQPQNK